MAPLSGKPNFSVMSLAKLIVYRDVVQEMMFVYQDCDKNIHNDLTTVWKDLSNAISDIQRAEPILPEVKENEKKLKTLKIKPIGVVKVKLSKTIDK